MALTLMLAPATAVPAGAVMVDITWSADGRFERRFTVPAGTVAEACTTLDAGATVTWRFEADAAMAFNIHYHVADQVHHPVRRNGVRREAGTLRVSEPQDYCWMWSHRGSRDATVRLRLAR